MAAQASISSPSSFQLRWGLLRGKSPPILLSVRFRAPSRTRRLVIACADASKAAAGDAADGSRRQPESDPPSAMDKFAGWLGEDKDDESPSVGGRFGGITGAVLAGVFLVGGLAFASLSLTSKRQSGFKSQMQPLTTKQETLLSSDIRHEKILCEEKDSTGNLEDNGSSPVSGIKSETQPLTAEETSLSSDSECNKILFKENSSERREDNYRGIILGSDGYNSSPESIELVSPSMPDEKSLKTSSLGSEPELLGNVETSHDKDVIVNTHTEVGSLVSSHSSTMEESSAPEPVDASSFENVESQVASGDVDSADQFYERENLDHVTLSSASKLKGLGINDQDKGFISPELEKSPSVGDPSSQFSSVDSGIPSTLDPNLTLHTQGTRENIEFPEVELREPDNGLPRMKELETLNDDSVISVLEDNSTRSVLSGTISSSTFSQFGEHKFGGQTINSTLIENPLNDSSLSEASFSAVDMSSYMNESNFGQQDEISISPTSASVHPKMSFTYAGIPAPSMVSPALQVQLGKVLVPAVIDQVQGQTLAALQVLKVIEADVQPGEICSRREYARWLVSASSVLSRSVGSKVYPAMYIENVTELAFDDITPEDPDFPCIQGLAEAGLISSKLSRLDNMSSSLEEQHTSVYFSPERPLSRQDLVSWKMALEKSVLPDVDRKTLQERSGYIDIDRINPDAWPAIVSDLSSGENGIISLAFGYTRLFQPEKPVTKAQAAVALSTGDAAEVVGEELARIEAESLAETAVLAHTALVAEVENDLNLNFEKELAIEREKINAMERLAQQAKQELEKLRREREEESHSLFKERATVESELEILSKLRNDVEEQLQNLLSNKMEIAFENERANKLREEAERENLAISQLKYELEIEKKALAMARAWAEDEAKRAREQAKALEEARERWEKGGIKVLVDKELRESESAGLTWQIAEEQVIVEETAIQSETPKEEVKFQSQQHLLEGLKARAEQLVAKLSTLLVKVKGKSAAVIEGLIQKIRTVISDLQQHASSVKMHVIEAKKHASDRVANIKDNMVARTSTTMQNFRDNASEFGSSVREGTRRASEEFREGIDRITQRFKT